MNPHPYIRWFQEIGIGDVGLVGGKNASLGEMYRELTSKGIRIPNGFAVTAEGYRHFLKESGLDEKIAAILRGLDTGNLTGLAERGRQGARRDSRRLVAGGLGASHRRRVRQAVPGVWPGRPIRPCAPVPRPKIFPTRASRDSKNRI